MNELFVIVIENGEKKKKLIAELSLQELVESQQYYLNRKQKKIDEVAFREQELEKLKSSIVTIDTVLKGIENEKTICEAYDLILKYIEKAQVRDEFKESVLDKLVQESRAKFLNNHLTSK